jgi:hypothetical protein
MSNGVRSSSTQISADGIHHGDTESTEEEKSFLDRINRIDGMYFDLPLIL